MSDGPADKSQVSPGGGGFRVREGAMDDLLNETRALQRRVSFWQRTAWMLLGTLVIFATVIWQRGELRRRECAYSLMYYADEAQRDKLGTTSNEMLETQWQSLDPGSAKLAPNHYDLIVKNWQVAPKSGESLPLAVCRESHFLAVSRGRHVLLRETGGFRVEWYSEERAEPIVREAAADNRGRSGT